MLAKQLSIPQAFCSPPKNKKKQKQQMESEIHKQDGGIDELTSGQDMVFVWTQEKLSHLD